MTVPLILNVMCAKCLRNSTTLVTPGKLALAPCPDCETSAAQDVWPHFNARAVDFAKSEERRP